MILNLVIAYILRSQYMDYTRIQYTVKQNVIYFLKVLYSCNTLRNWRAKGMADS